MKKKIYNWFEEHERSLKIFVFLFRQNEGGRSLKLKCSSVKEAEDWREALEAESAVPLDSSHVSLESPVTEVTIYLLYLS